MNNISCSLAAQLCASLFQVVISYHVYNVMIKPARVYSLTSHHVLSTGHHKDN